MRTSVNAGVAGLATATAALLLVTIQSASGEHQSPSSAYGVSVGGSPGQPSVQSDGTETRTGGGHVPAQLGPLAAGGALEVTAGNDRATAKIADLTLGQAAAQLPPELREGIARLTEACTVAEQAGGADKAIEPLNAAIDKLPGVGEVVDLPTAEAAAAFCNGLLDADIVSLAKIGSLQSECNDQVGTVTVNGVETLGAQQPVLVGEVAPDTQLLPEQLAKAARITLNHQTREGESLTVDGLRVEVGGKEVAVLASVTCHGPAPHAPEVKGEQAKQSKPKPAPVPVPTQASAPVTG